MYITETLCVALATAPLFLCHSICKEHTYLLYISIYLCLCWASLFHLPSNWLQISYFHKRLDWIGLDWTGLDWIGETIQLPPTRIKCFSDISSKMTIRYNLKQPAISMQQKLIAEIQRDFPNQLNFHANRLVLFLSLYLFPLPPFEHHKSNKIKSIYLFY